jgi:ubiquitin-protein ligase
MSASAQNNVPLPSALALLSDYAEMRVLMSYGLWLMPDTLDLRVFHGLLAVREGRYAGGLFRFALCAHEQYPAADGARPLVVMLPPRPYHPLVCAASGALQIEARFAAWRGGADRLPLVVELVREVLTSDLVLVPPAAGGARAYNAEAARLARASPVLFAAAAARSAAAAAAAARGALARGPALAPQGLAGVLAAAGAGTGASRHDYLGAAAAAEAGAAGDAGGGGSPLLAAAVYADPAAAAAARWAPSPYTAGAAARLLGRAGDLSPDGRRCASALCAIGRSRGFRLSEPGPAHISLLEELTAAGAAAAPRMLARGLPAWVDELREPPARGDGNGDGDGTGAGAGAGGGGGGGGRERGGEHDGVASSDDDDGGGGGDAAAFAVAAADGRGSLQQ